MRIALVGNSGSGKSTLSQQLATLFLLTWVREYYSRAGDLSLAAHQT
jgi:adenylate kinase family enzyme